MFIHIKDALNNIISEGTGLSPLTTPSLLATTNSVTEPISIIVYTDEGYATEGDTTISFVGSSASKWSVCETVDGTYGASLILSSPITYTGLTVYVKAASSSDEVIPVNDDSVDIHIAATIGAV